MTASDQLALVALVKIKEQILVFVYQSSLRSGGTGIDAKEQLALCLGKIFALDLVLVVTGLEGCIILLVLEQRIDVLGLAHLFGVKVVDLVLSVLMLLTSCFSASMAAPMATKIL